MMFERLLQQWLIQAIALYQRHISPTLASRVQCRFHPTCSDYAILAIRKHGVLQGGRKAISRLSRCRPDNLNTCIDYP